MCGRAVQHRCVWAGGSDVCGRVAVSAVAMAAIPVEFEWVTPVLVGLGILCSMVFVLCPRKMVAQTAFDEATRPAVVFPEETAPAEGSTEGM